ncbi:DUF4127 family protein [Paenibacillus sp. D2_2]|uniref:DUF4127 family protein n=1 Tax=Paenibacillus sp. D2_2 TaxID=3073092 RepID=UPI00281587DB|nr:DUF4127 family protein [Paenibacillus sp. D2_2]WMT42180.1 DUF4127 family protein [Paenibacillus sp. D2_2]
MKKVLYVPLDDRPVNLDDVITLGRSAGLQLITPDPMDIRNRIDAEAEALGDQLIRTCSPTFGNTANIRQFIIDHAAKVDGFIISIDMLAYGGLIGARRLRENGAEFIRTMIPPQPICSMLSVRLKSVIPINRSMCWIRLCG